MTPLSKHSTRDKVLMLIQNSGGSVRTSQRGLAAAVECSPGRVAQELKGMREDGVIVVRAGSTGTLLQLAGAI